MQLPDFALRLLRALPEAAMLVRPDGGIIAANGAARSALLLAPGEGQLDCQLLSLVSDADNLRATLRAWSRSTDSVPGSFELASNRTPINARGSLMLPRNGEVPPVLLVRFWPRAEANPFLLLNQKLTQLNDEVTRRKSVELALRTSEAKLRERADEAEALNRSKDEFLATLSHELRTPLNAILGWASFLDGRVIDAQTRKAMNVIHRNALVQARLIDDILDVSRIITGKLKLDARPVDLGAIVDQAVEVTTPGARAKRVEIEVDRPAEEVLLVADGDRLRQVLWNLLSNAVKFSNEGGLVRLRIERDGDCCRIAVTDNGQGIDPAFLPYVFDRFRQQDGSTTRRTGGLGLGLALVRHIVEMHGGRVEASSGGLGQGATFRLTLPARRPTASAPSTGPPTDRGSLRGLRLLVVDDEPDAQDVVSTLLESRGAEVRTAGSAAEAFEAFQRHKPHLVVSDIGMPGEDGYGLIRRIRALENGAGRAPAIALTAYNMPADRVNALEAGFDAHLAKPLDIDRLIELIRELCPA